MWSPCTQPAPISDKAYQNKTVVYTILFQAAAATLLTIAGDTRHLGVQIGVTMVLHTRGSAMTHHPMCIVLCLAVVSRSRTTSGSTASRDSSSLCACCHVCSGA
jgi:hypothetical protein